VSGQNGNLLKINSFNDSRNTDINSLVARQTDYIKRLYSEKVEAPKEIINGKEYEPYYLRSEVKPLLFPGKKRTASIFTKTRRYNNLTLQYDTFLDEVIYTDISRTINFRFPQIALNKDILDGFNLYFEDDSLKFRYFRLPECSEKNLKEGFYEVVCEGKSSYIIKHESSFYERKGLNNYKYSPKNFISTGGAFYKIKTRKNLQSLFGEKYPQIKAYLYSSGIRMRKADKDQILSIVKFYDSLTKSD
jgi:hypothetical protein